MRDHAGGALQPERRLAVGGEIAIISQEVYGSPCDDGRDKYLRADVDRAENITCIGRNRIDIAGRGSNEKPVADQYRPGIGDNAFFIFWILEYRQLLDRRILPRRLVRARTSPRLETTKI